MSSFVVVVSNTCLVANVLCMHDIGSQIMHCAKIDLYGTKTFEPLTYCTCDGKVTFSRPFLILDNVTFDEHMIILYTFTKL